MKISSAILLPLMIWFILSLVSIFDKDYIEVVNFFTTQSSKFLVSHAESVNIEFVKSFSLGKIKSLLNNAEGCEVYDKREDGGYITPIEAEGKNETYISRIREDKTKEKTINMWIVSDNLLRGAALNTIEIAELLIKKING